MSWKILYLLFIEIVESIICFEKYYIYYFLKILNLLFENVDIDFKECSLYFLKNVKYIIQKCYIGFSKCSMYNFWKC
jgi:hypothetical protein